jgi:hypothetical protein
MADQLDATQFEELFVEMTKKHWPRYFQPDSIADEEIGDGQVWRWDEGEGVNRPASLSAGHTEDHDHDGLPTQKLLADNTHEGTPAPGAHHDPGDEHAESHAHISHTGINPGDHHDPVNDHAPTSDHVRLHNLLEPLDHGDTAFTRAAVQGNLIVGISGSPNKWDQLIHGATGTYARWDGNDLLPSVIPARDPLGGGAIIGNAFEEEATFTLSLDIVIVSGPYPVLVDTVAKSVWVYCSVNTGSVLGKAVIYDETAGNEPQALLGESDEVSISNTTVAWVEFPFSGTLPSLAAGANYFIGFHVDGGGGGTPNVLLRFSNASINRASTVGIITYRDVIDPYSAGAPDPWLIASDTPDGTQLIAAYIEPDVATGSDLHLRAHNHANASDGADLIPSSVNVTSDFYMTGEFLDTSISGTFNDYSPSAGVPGSGFILNATGATIITGIVPSAGGQMIFLYNYGTFTITLNHLDGGSAASNQFQFSGGADIVVSQYEGVWLYKDANQNKWIAIGEHRPSASASGFPLTGPWTFRTDTGTTPTSGRLTMDNVTTASVTNVYANELDSETRDRSLMFGELADGDDVWIWEAADVTNLAHFTVNGTPSLLVDVWTIPVTYVADAGTTPWSQNTGIRLGFLAAGGGAGHTESHDHDGAPTPQLLAANTHGTPAIDTHHFEAHDHDGTPTPLLQAVNTHQTPSPDTHHDPVNDHVQGSDTNDHLQSHDVPSHTGAPTGQLGGTWTSTTVDASHAGSTHHDEAHGHMNIFQFSGRDEDAAEETMLPQAHYIGESADRGTLTLVRFKVWVSAVGVTGSLVVSLWRVAGPLTGDTEVKIAEVTLTTGDEGDDDTVATLSTNEYIRAKITTIHSGTPAKDVNCALVVTQAPV